MGKKKTKNYTPGEELLLTEKNKEFILQHFYDMSGPELSEALNLSLCTIYRYAQSQGYQHRLGKNCLLRECDYEIFVENFPFYYNFELCEKFFPYLTPDQIKSMASRWGLKKDTFPKPYKYDDEMLLNTLKQAIQEHGRVPTLTEIREWTGYPESTYRYHFGNFTEICKMIEEERPEYLPSSRKNKVKEAYIGKDGNKYHSISEIIIGDELYELGYQYYYDKTYIKFFNIEDFGTMRFDWYLYDLGIVIEFFGLPNQEKYAQKMHLKQQICQKNNIKLISLFPEDVENSNLLNLKEILKQKIEELQNK